MIQREGYRERDTERGMRRSPVACRGRMWPGRTRCRHSGCEAAQLTVTRSERHGGRGEVRKGEGHCGSAAAGL